MRTHQPSELFCNSYKGNIHCNVHLTTASLSPHTYPAPLPLISLLLFSYLHCIIQYAVSCSVQIKNGSTISVLASNASPSVFSRQALHLHLLPPSNHTASYSFLRVCFTLTFKRRCEVLVLKLVQHRQFAMKSSLR